jgi:hypothetical protein
VKFSEAATEAIRLADARRAYWDAELPKHHPAYPLIRAGERPAPSPPEDGQLRSLLRSLPPEVTYKLILTMYLGRGDFGTDAIGEEYKDLKKTFPEPRIAASQMSGKVPLGDYLRDGLARLRRAGIDLDTLSFEPCEVS